MSQFKDIQDEFARIVSDWMSLNRFPERPPHIKESRDSTVYFFRNGPYIKIGYSVDPHRRLVQIRGGDSTKCPDGLDRSEMVLVQTEAGGRGREYELHQQFKHLHHWGGWFTEAPELTEYIESLSEVAA